MLIVTWTVVGIVLCISSSNGQDYPPNTGVLSPYNCYYNYIYEEEGSACDGVVAPYMLIPYWESYPDDGLCIVRNLEMNSYITSYKFRAPICSTATSYSNYANGIFFNMQDQNNYDTFYVTPGESYDAQCIVGYVLGGAVYEKETYECKTDTNFGGWLSFEVESSFDSTVVTLNEFNKTDGISHTFQPHFPSRPNAGPLFANDDYDSYFQMYFAATYMEELNDTTAPLTTEAVTPDTGTAAPTPDITIVPTPDITVVPTPDDNSTEINPQYQIRLQAPFTSSTGEDFSSSCTNSYSLEMSQKVQEMSFAVNLFIGDTLCTGLTSEDIGILSASGQMNFRGNIGEARPSFYVKFSPDLLLSELESCITDMKNFLIPHSNWGEHVVSPVPGCPQVDFSDDVFNDYTDFWVCVDSKGSRNESMVSQSFEPPQYSFGHSGELYTESGVDLSPACQDVYSSVLFDQTNSLIGEINAAPDETHLCGDTDYQLSIRAAYVSASGSQGISLQDYLLRAYDAVRFSDIQRCADVMLSYLADHSSWPDPIIPAKPGCPQLLFTESSFTERYRQWVCVGIQTTKDDNKDPALAKNKKKEVDRVREIFMKYFLKTV